MAGTARFLIRALALVTLGSLAACSGPVVAAPTAQPLIRVTPAPAQDVQGTAEAYRRRGIATPTPAGLYIVKAGDTLSKIADEFQTTIDEIMTLNNLSDPNLLEIGQQLTIPSLLPTQTSESVEADTGEGPPEPAPEAPAPAPEAPAPAPEAPSPEGTATP